MATPSARPARDTPALRLHDTATALATVRLTAIWFTVPVARAIMTVVIGVAATPPLDNARKAAWLWAFVSRFQMIARRVCISGGRAAVAARSRSTLGNFRRTASTRPL
jgi:hypothetical protein